MRRCMGQALASGVMLAATAVAAGPRGGQAQAPASPNGSMQFSGSARWRSENWDWFTPSSTSGADRQYSFFAAVLKAAVGARRASYDWLFELEVPVLVNLPDRAVAPAPQGALGFGGTYWAENGDRKIGLVPKQGFVRFRFGDGPTPLALRLGRFDYNDGQEVQPQDPTLAWLKRERISQRLIGNFGFSHVGRSLDGVQLVKPSPGGDVTLLAARPTQGVFQLNGLGEVNAELGYLAVTRPFFPRRGAEGETPAAEGRLFVVYYQDQRGVVKTDNRPASVRAGDSGDIRIATFGAHYLHTLPIGPGTGDFLLWGAYQVGDWGLERHRAGALTAELGYRLARLPLKPWARVGYFFGSGDGNPNDGTHSTFFEVLPTPRPYARLPFYNLMNIEDAFAQVVVEPAARMTVRADAHRLRLAEPSDLWYSGGGAFDNTTFGYTGRPSGGNQSLAHFFDVSFDYQARANLGVTLYLGYVSGQDVIRATYPTGTNAALGYFEVTQRF